MKKTRSGKDVKCKECQVNASVQSGLGSSPGSIITREFILQVVRELKGEIFEEMRPVKKDVGDLAASAQHVSDRLDDLNGIMNEL